MTPAEVLHGISHANLLLYAAAIPPLDTGSDDKDDDRLKGLDWDGALAMDAPANINDNSNNDRTRI